MRAFSVPSRVAAVATALTLAAAMGTPALADNIPMSQGICLGQGRNHDQAYNNAYAQCRTTMNLACVVGGGQLTNVSVDTESDFDYGRGIYQINLSMSATCVTNSN